jgi:hypothetical protein
VRELAIGLWAYEDPDTRTNGDRVRGYKLTELGGYRIEYVRSTVIHGVEVRSGTYCGVHTNVVRPV